VLPQNPQAAWRAHLSRVPIGNEPTFTPDGLVLGAGTVLVEPQVGRLLKSVKGQEARVLALLSAAHGRAVARSVLDNIERATKAWGEGDDCLCVYAFGSRRPAAAWGFAVRSLSAVLC
jgi:hypothetical protein